MSYRPKMILTCNVCREKVLWEGPLRHGPEPFVCDGCEVKLLEARYWLS